MLQLLAYRIDLECVYLLALFKGDYKVYTRDYLRTAVLEKVISNPYATSFTPFLSGFVQNGNTLQSPLNTLLILGKITDAVVVLSRTDSASRSFGDFPLYGNDKRSSTDLYRALVDKRFQ